MSYSDAIERGLKRRKERELMTTVSTTDGGFSGAIARGLQRKHEREALRESDYFAAVGMDDEDEDIAPVKDGPDFFQKGAFEDGFDWSDIPSAILGTAGDIGLNIAKGAGGMLEGIADTINYGIAGVADAAGKDDFADRIRKNTQKSAMDEWTQGADDYLNQYSVLGQTSDSIAQGIGQVGTLILTGGIGSAAGMGATGVTALTTGAMGLSGTGSGMGEAYNAGANDLQALKHGLNTGAADALSELIFGGLGKAVNALGFSKGLSSVDDMLAKLVGSKFKNQMAKNLVEFGIKAGAEGLEEVIAGVAQAYSKYNTYLKDQGVEFEDILKDENLLEQFVVGAFTSGITQTSGLHIANKTNTDFITGMTQNEQAVAKKEIENRIAEQEKDGKKLTAKEKSAIETQVERDLEKGYISTDTIEEVLGGETYKAYKDTIESEDSLLQEFDTLYKMKQSDMTGEQIDRLAQLKPQAEEIRKNNKRGQLKDQLSQEVFNLAKGDRLRESYSERARRGERYQADLSKYDAKQQAVIQNAVNSGILNNTNRTHEFVDLVAKISADKGVAFDFTNNEKLKASGFAMDGKTVNGFVSKDGVTVNIQSAKALNSVVGHEITHVLEGTELYSELKQAVVDYAKAKNDYQGRFDSLTKLYEGVKGADIDAELTADLVGDYLFTDYEFVNSLSTDHRNVFQKLYDEVKYLLKVATAGSKEARELEKVKRVFEKAYRENGKSQMDTKYSVSDSEGVQVSESDDMENENVVSMDGDTVSRFSLSTWTPEMQTKVRENLVKAGYEEGRVDKWIKDTNSVASVIAADRDRLDFEAADNQTMLKSNQEYVKTLDASTLCAKRLVYQGTFDAIQHRMPNTMLSSDDLIDLLNMMKKHGVQTPCGVCYVESRRRHLGKFAQEWLNGYKGEYKPNLDEVTTSDGLEALRKSHPQTYEDFITAMKKKGSANPKVVQLRTEYRNEIMSLTPAQIRKIEAIGGLRVQSFSDFETPHLLDMMQAVMDMSAKGLTSQAYTKVPNFAWVFGNTGIKINLSLIAEGNGFDADGNLAFSSTEGMDIDEAMKLRDAYSANVGTIIVGANDKHIIACMADNRIDFIIPFHRSGWGQKELNMMGMEEYEDYTYGQNEHSLETGKGVPNLYPPDYWDYNLSGKENAERYLSLCARTGREPKFSRFLVNNGDGSYSLQPDGSTDGYWKMLIDFKMYDNEGNGAAQQKVQPNFNMEEAYRVLSEYEGGANRLPVAQEVVEEFVSKYQSKADLAPVMSLSAEGAQAGTFGNYNIQGEDVVLDIAPVREDIAPVREDIAPVRADLDALMAQRNDLKRAMQTASENGDTSTLTQLTQEFVGLQARIGEMEAQNVEATTEPTPTAATDGAEAPAKRLTRKQLHQNILSDIKSRFAEHGFDFDAVLQKARNLSTFATVDNTPQRVMEKSLGYKEGGILSDLTVNKVAQNETEGIQWLNSFTDRKNGVLAQISRKYNIKPGSKKSAAAQMYAEGFYVDEKNNIVQYGDAELAADFPDVTVQRQIKGLARDPQIRRIYDDTLAAINASRTRNAYPEIPRLDNYFLHFRAMEDTFSRLGLPFNPNDIRAKDLPTDLNGVTADLKPGQPYFASAKHRTGKRTSFDLLGGLERYLTSAKNQIYHIDDIQTLRALRNYVAETYGQATGLENLDELTDAEAEERIEQVYNSHLSTFAKFLNEEANILAGKTALIDRGLEGIIGRRGITFLNTVNGQVGKNMVGFNLSSSLTNFVPVVQTFAKTNKADFVKAFSQTVANKVGSIFGRNDGFAGSSPVIIRRKGADSFYRTPYQKVSDAGYVLMSAVDDISTELIARTKYNEFIRKGMDSQKAHYETDKWVSRLMGDRSLGQQPQLYNSKMLGLVTKFQLEVRNQLDSQFYDTIQEAKVSTEDIQNGIARNAMKAAKIASTFTQLAVVQHLFGTAFESVAGYNPAFDIIEVLMTACGWDDDEESEDTVLDNIEQGFLALLEDLPYASTLTGGRIPIESALPIAEFVKGEDTYGNEKSRWETVAEVAPYYLLPGGYGQIKKTRAGLNMFSDDHPIAGSYTNAGKLRFPVEDTLGNRVQAAVFGQYASGNARDYFDNDRSALTDTQLAEFMELDAPIQDYWEYRDGLKALSKQAEDRGETLKQADKLKYINGLDLTKKQKDVLKSYLFDEDGYKKDNPGKYAFLEKEGIGYLGYKQLDEDTQEAWSWAYSHQDEYRFYKKNGVMPEDYSVYRVPMLDFDNKSNEAYQWAFDNPEKATFGKVFGDGVREYRQYAEELSAIHADKDSNGKTINGSAKQKKLDYINSLDIDYGEKLILYKNEYNADDTYNEQIIEYLNGRTDISFEEEIAILRELGFTVTDDGAITWD